MVQIHPPQPTYSTAYGVKRSCFIGHFHKTSTNLSGAPFGSLTSREDAWHTGTGYDRSETRISACTISRWLSCALAESEADHLLIVSPSGLRTLNEAGANHVSAGTATRVEVWLQCAVNTQIDFASLVPQGSRSVLTERETSGYLRVSLSTLRRWRKSDGGPAFIRFGKSIRYRVQDLDRFLSDSRSGGAL